MTELQHDRRVAAAFGALLLALAVFIVGVQVGMRQVRQSPPAEQAAPAEQMDPVTLQAGQGIANPELDYLREEMEQDCSVMQLADAIAAARAYRETAAGLTALGETVKNPVAYRQSYGIAAVAYELMVQRCLAWRGRL